MNKKLNSVSSDGTKDDSSTTAQDTSVCQHRSKPHVGGSLLPVELIEAKAKEETSFPKMCYPNEMMALQCRKKYEEGALWAIEQITDEKIDAFITELMREQPVKFLQYALILIGRDIYQSNASEFTFSQESDLAKGERFKINIVGTIEKVVSQ